MDRKFWWHMDNGQQRRELEFVAYYRAADGEELTRRFTVANPPFWDGEPDTFRRLSFERVQDIFAAAFNVRVDHIIRGEVLECGNGSVRDCYVYAGSASRVPIGTIRPAVFVR